MAGRSEYKSNACRVDASDLVDHHSRWASDTPQNFDRGVLDNKQQRSASGDPLNRSRWVSSKNCFQSRPLRDHHSEQRFGRTVADWDGDARLVGPRRLDDPDPRGFQSNSYRRVQVEQSSGASRKEHMRNFRSAKRCLAARYCAAVFARVVGAPCVLPRTKMGIHGPPRGGQLQNQSPGESPVLTCAGAVTANRRKL